MSQRSTDIVRARLRPFGIVFEKSLTDLIKGIRANKEPEALAKFLQDAINECRKEVRSADMDLKTMAVLKLAYLEMYGFDMSWANFHVLEVMSSSKFQQKRVGYLTAIQSFKNDNDVLMLTTNLLKKDLNSPKSVEVGVALSGISTIVTTNLAADITDDIIQKLNHSKPYIRKKAVLSMYKIFLKYPDALRTHLQRVFDKLDDDDESVVTATITVICELSKKTPKLLIRLAPQLYNLLNTSNNNWMLIRLLKLFSYLSQIEPRLKLKLLDPVLELMSKTKASSLIYECINCLVAGEMIDESDHHIAGLCLDELTQFFKENDSNLKYVALLAFLKIGKINTAFIVKYSDYILEFIEDDDVTIREKALELIHGISDEENLFKIVKLLMIQLIPIEQQERDDEDDEDQESDNISNILNKGNNHEPIIVLSDQYKNSIVKKILEISSVNNYSNIPSFEWYIQVLSDLIDLSVVNNLSTGEILGEQLRDIAIRVPSVRKDVVSTSIKIINDAKIANKLPQVLKHIVWLIGEYSNFIKNGDVFIYSLLESRDINLLKLDSSILIIFIPAVIKIYNNFINKDIVYWDNFKKETIIKLTRAILEFLNKISISKDFEVQERSVEFIEFLKIVLESIEEHDDGAIEPPLLITTALPSLFNSWELNPIGQGSQKRIGVPAGLDLDSPIYEDIFDDLDRSDNDESIIEEFEEDLYDDHGSYKDDDDDYEHEQQDLLGRDHHQPSEDAELRKKERLERLKDDPYYLSNDSNSQILSPRIKTEHQTPTPRSITPSLVTLEDPIKPSKKSSKKPKKKNVIILSDEVINGNSDQFSNVNSPDLLLSDQESFRSNKGKKKNLLTIDSSNLDNFDINEPIKNPEKDKIDGSYEVAKLRQQLEKQDLINNEPEDSVEEVIVIRKKKKKTVKYDENGNVIEKKKKKKKKHVDEETEE